MKIVFYILSSLLSLVFIGACSRPTLDKSSLKIALPSILAEKVSTSAVKSLKHIIINITGSGMTPLVFTWDANSSTNAPSEFIFELQQGSSRMIQVLGVYTESSNESLFLYYGDKTVDLSGGEVVVDLALNSLTTLANVSGRISGRYFNSATSGPTGGVDIRYTPPGKPAMIIERGQIAAGWFSFFGLSELALEYRITSGPDAGTLLFGQPISLKGDSFLVAGSMPANIFKMAIPVHLRDTAANQEEAKMYLWGWFSDGSTAANSAISANVICPPAGVASRLKKYNDVNTVLTINSYAAGSFPLANELTDITSPSGAIAKTGGSDPTTCAAKTEYSNKLSILAYNLENGSDSSAPFRTPFRLLNATSGKSLIYSGTANIFNGQLLPGTETLFDGVTFYGYAPAIANNIKPKDGAFPCTNIPAPPTAIVNVSNPTEAAVFPVDFAPYGANGSTYSSGICMMKNGKPFGNGVWKEADSNSNSPYMRIEIPGSLSSTTDGSNIETKVLRVGKCYQINPTLYQSGSAWNVPSGSLQINGSSLTTSPQIYYTDASCTTSASGINYYINNGFNTTASALYYKSSNAVNGVPFTLSFTDTTGASVQPSMNMYQRINFVKQLASFEMLGAGPYYNGICIPVQIAIRNEFAGNSFENATDNYTFDFINQGSTTGSVYSNSGCSAGPYSSINIPAGNTTQSLWVKFNGIGNGKIKIQPANTPTDDKIAVPAATEAININIDPDPCLASIGATCLDGTKYAGTFNGFKYFTTAGGCNNVVTPTCPGTTDSLTLAWADGTGGSPAMSLTIGASDINDGAINGPQHLVYSDTKAAQFCESMVYQGYSDWYLPAENELQLLYNNKAAIGGFMSGNYWASNETSSSVGQDMSFTDGSKNHGASKNNAYYVRCVRKAP